MKKLTDKVSRDKIVHKVIDLQTLKESDARFRSIVLCSPDAIIVTDAKGKIEYMNPAAEGVFNRKLESFIGKNFGLPLVDGESTEIDIFRPGKDPGVGDMHVVESEWLRKKAHLIRIRDITERKKAEGALRESESKFKVLFTNAPEGILVADLQTKRFRYANPSICKMFGYTEEEFLRINVADLHPKEFLNHVLAEFENEKLLSTEFPCLRKDGTLFYAIINSIGMVLDGHKCRVGFFTDITERRKAEEAQKQLVAIVEATLDFVGFADAKDKHIIYINKAGRKMCGIGNDEDVTKLKINDIHPEWVNKILVKEALPTAMRDGAWNGECAFLNIRNKYEIPVSMSLSSHKNSNGEVEIFSTISHDITKRRKTEEKLKETYSRLNEARVELIQAEKANVIVQLAGGVAHEVKNPLAIIMQADEYLEKNITSRKKNIPETLHAIKDNVKRIDKIIRTLADFVRITELDLKLQDVKPVIARSLDLIKCRVKLENIKIVKEFKKDLPEVLIDSAKLEQVFVNLFLNAVQAMPNGGKIFIRGYSTKLEKLQNRVGRRDNDYFRLAEKAVIIEIEDTGIGIPKENLQKIFTPFFTTKGPREGAGLGLSVTKNIIDLHRGMIEMQSEENKGTKFIITLKIHGGE